MGSNSSQEKPYQDTSQYGQIYLETDKTAYHAGETVTGKIFLNLISHYPGNQLFLKLKGREVVHLVKLKRIGKSYQEQIFSEDRNLINEETLVYSWDSLLPGQFIIPFSFWLPPTLPPSFFQQGPRYLAGIEYHLEAILKPHQNEIPKMKYKQSINLRETVIKAENLSLNTRTLLKTWFCCNQGSNFLKTKFEKNYYSPGEKAQVLMELDNSETQLQNLEIVLSLKQLLEVRAEGEDLALEIQKVKQVLPGIPKAFNQKAEALHITLPRSATETDYPWATNLEALIKQKENPYIITSNTNSPLIKSQYFLEVSCPMSGCYPQLPFSECPIYILSPDSQFPAVSPPNNWQPVSLDSVALVFPPDIHQSLLYEYNNSFMNEDRMSHVNTEMTQISMPNQKYSNNDYNQNYYKK